MTFPKASGQQSAGQHVETLQLNKSAVPSGLYFLVVQVEEKEQSFKINIVR